jgi:DNA-binding response OmpR family regulator
MTFVQPTAQIKKCTIKQGEKMGAHILIVEDESKLARYVELELLHEGYEVTKSENGREALELALSNHFDLILLDIMLPGLNGLEVLRRLNKEQEMNPTPVILLTARDAVMDKVSGLDAGAVDYITKPFAIEELLARIRVALKLYEARNRGASSGAVEKEKEEGVYTWNKLRLDEKRHTVHFDGHEVTLTNREFLMLETLLANMDIVLSRDTLLEKVCGYDYIGETNVIDVYVRYLRSKIDEAYGVKMIQTVRGVGYVIKSETDA